MQVFKLSLTILCVSTQIWNRLRQNYARGEARHGRDFVPVAPTATNSTGNESRGGNGAGWGGF